MQEKTPDEGIAGFLDYARYSSGYAALHHTIAFMPETHMLKPYSDRVWSTYEFMASMIEFLSSNGESVRSAKMEAGESYSKSKQGALDWQIDAERADSILFKGYEAGYKASEVSGLSRLYYDRNKPYEKMIPFYDSYKPKLMVDIPKAYLIPQAYTEVMERLKWNGVKVERLQENEVKLVHAYYIEDYVDLPAYEGHYLHTKTKVRKEELELQFYAGDYLIKTDQASARYIVETLEPQAPDSYFSWNFFDGILMQKEYFSSYVFEDLAAKLLSEDEELRKEFQAERSKNPEFAEDARAQLDFIYKRSPYYEKNASAPPSL